MLSETNGRVRLKIDAVTRFCDQTGCCSKDGPGEGADFATGNNCFGSINDGVFGAPIQIELLLAIGATDAVREKVE